MTCDDSRPFFHAYLDGELDATQAAEFGRHMESCSACGRAVQALESLRSSMQNAQLREPLPVGFERKIRRQLDEASQPASSWKFTQWRVLAAAAVLLLVIGGSWKFAQKPHDNGEVPVTGCDDAAVEIVCAHMCAVQPCHLIDCTCDDQI